MLINVVVVTITIICAAFPIKYYEYNVRKIPRCEFTFPDDQLSGDVDVSWFTGK